MNSLITNIMDDREIVQSIFNDATKDRFIMIIDIPSMLKDPRNPCKNIIKRNSYKLATTITGTVFPKIVVPQTNIQYAGSQMMVSSHTRAPYDTQVFSFNVINNWENYLVMQQWLNLLHNEVDGSWNTDEMSDLVGDQVLDKDAIKYFSTFTVYIVDEMGKPVLKGTYTNAFPVGLSEISLKYEDSDEIRIDVEFGFSQFQLTSAFELDE
tara:strand:+ start:12101 stop:12730 length:630 start_codon:yes stop_codon:yes gene_type:complete